jgi:hypothetical protein
MADDTSQRLADAEEHRKAYQSIMKAGTEIGVPFSMALTMFFTVLVMAKGIGAALVMAVITYLFVHFVVKAFFTH